MTKRFPTVALALVASLALNGFLVAYITVSWAGPRGPALHATPHSMLTELADRLPKADGAVLRTAIARHAGKLGESGGALQARRAEVARLLERPELDPEELKRLMEAARADRHETSEAMVEVLVEAMPQISHKTRVRIASLLKPR